MYCITGIFLNPNILNVIWLTIIRYLERYDCWRNGGSEYGQSGRLLCRVSVLSCGLVSRGDTLLYPALTSELEGPLHPDYARRRFEFGKHFYAPLHVDHGDLKARARVSTRN